MSSPLPSPADLTREPPIGFWRTVGQIGPGLILVGSIVGSGELITTPSLSARAGYSFLWLILFSCFIKVFFQIEVGRLTIATGKTALDSFTETPGPRPFGIHWILWGWIITQAAILVQLGGILGGVAQSLRAALPGLQEQVISWGVDPARAPGLIDQWGTVLVGLSVAILLVAERYKAMEKTAIILVAGFTAVTVYSMLHLQFTDRAMTWADLKAGFTIDLPADPAKSRELLMYALMAFGITGVGSAEIVAYPYWCLEKGYARHTGPAQPDEGWTRRAKGWVRVMNYDAWLSMIVFTVATLAFYILGAALLHERYVANPEDVPKGDKMVAVLSTMYVQTFGDAARYLFVIGAFCVLYSTAVFATAANARITADWFGLVGCYDRHDSVARGRWIRTLCVLMIITGIFFYSFVGQPVIMVGLSGIVQAIFLPMVGVSVLYHCKRVDARVRGSAGWQLLLLVAFILMSISAAYMGWNEVLKFFPKPVTN